MLLILGFALVVLLVGFLLSKKTGPKGATKQPEAPAKADAAAPAKKKAEAPKEKAKPKRQETPVDPLRINLFKGHTDDVLDVAFVGAGALNSRKRLITAVTVGDLLTSVCLSDRCLAALPRQQLLRSHHSQSCLPSFEAKLACLTNSQGTRSAL
jgi:hypothetical protein